MWWPVASSMFFDSFGENNLILQCLCKVGGLSCLENEKVEHGVTKLCKNTVIQQNTDPQFQWLNYLLSLWILKKVSLKAASGACQKCMATWRPSFHLDILFFVSKTVASLLILINQQSTIKTTTKNTLVLVRGDQVLLWTVPVSCCLSGAWGSGLQDGE